MNNKEFSVNDDVFRTCCARAGIEKTKRQASKFRMGKGRAFAEKSNVIAGLKKAQEKQVQS